MEVIDTETVILEEITDWADTISIKYSITAEDEPFYLFIERVLKRVPSIEYNLIRGLIEEVTAKKFPDFEAGRIDSFSELWAKRAEAISEYVYYIENRKGS